MKIILFIILYALLPSNQQSSENRMLLNYSIMKTEHRWRIVNDGVMGGLSSSRIVMEGGKIVFTGNISLKNNGGFASLRSPVKDYNFEEFSGLELRVKGDGKRYSISMKETTYFTGIFYTSTFKTKEDEWINIKMHFNEFKRYYVGRETDSNKKLALNNIKEVSFLIGDKQEGEFRTEIEYLQLY